jgi:filamentous hemagglutinin family protein
MRTNRDRRTIRRMLVLGTALSGSWVGAGLWPAMAAQIGGGALPSGVSVSGKSSDLTVSLKNNAVIGWNNLDIDAGNSVDFVDGRILGNGGAIAVLNRDNSGHATSINGSLTSDPNIAVWIYNPSGILIGSHAHLSTGSLVLTTLNPDDNDFKANVNPSSYALTDPGLPTKGIIVSDGASLSVSGGSRGLILVAPVINATGTFDATGQKPDIFHARAADQDVAFITASAVTLSYSAGSPVSVKIDKGTTINNASAFVGGKVLGRNVLFAVASQSTVTGVLLNVAADVTSATQSDKGIILTAGASASNVSLTAGTDTSGVVGLQTSGTLTTQDNDTDIAASANGAITIAGALDSARDVLVTGTGAAKITSTVSAARNYSVSAAGIELGGTQVAGGTLSVLSQNGAITGDAGLSLQSGANGGGGALTLRTTGATGGNIALSPDSTLLTGKNGNANADVQIGTAVASNSIALGNVIARALLGVVGTGGFGNTVSTTGALQVGNVNTTSALNMTGGTLTAGTLTSKGAIALQSTTSAQVAGLAAGGDAIVNGGTGSVAITGNVQAGGQYSVTGGTVTLGTASAATRQQANGAVTINGGAGGIRGLGTLTLESNADHSGTESLTLAITDATSDAAIDFDAGSALFAGPNGQSDLVIRSGTAAGVVALGNVTARNLLGAVGTAVPAQGLVRTGALRFGAMAVTGPLSLTGAAITTGTISSGGAVSLNAAGILTAASISAGGAVNLLGSGATAVAGQIKTSGGVTIDRGGALMLGSLQADGNVALGGTAGLTTITVAGTASSGGSFTALSTGAQHWGNVSSGGALSLTGAGIAAGQITSGGATILASTGDLAATAIDSADAITLTGTGATTIAGVVKTDNMSDGDLSIDRDGAIVLGGIDASRNVAIGSSVAPASVTVNGDAQAGGSFAVASGGAQNWRGGVSAGGALSLAPASGTLQVAGPITSSGAVTLASIDALTVGGKMQAGGTVSIKGTTVQLDDVATSGGNIDATASQGLTIGAVSAPGTTTLTAALGLQTGSVKGSQGVALAANGGALTVGGAIDGGSGAVSATATGAVNLQHGVTAGGNYQVSGTSVTLGGTQSAGGAVSVSATAGGITGLSGLVLTANNAGAGTDGITLSATGGPISLAGNSTLNGGETDHQSDVTITSDTGNIVLGDVNARTLSVNGGAQLVGGFTAGNLSLANGLTLVAGAPGAHLGDVTIAAGNLSLSALGAVQVGDVSTVGGTAQLTGTNLTFGSIMGAGATLVANGTAAGSGDIAGGAITATGPVQISALSGDGTVTLGPITTTGANGSLVLNAVGQVLLDKVNVSGTADIATVSSASDAASQADVLFKNGLTAGGTIHVSSTRDVRSDTIASTNGDLYINAPNGSVDSYTPGVGLNPSVAPGHTYSLNVGDNINLGVVIGGPISLTAKSITAISIDAGNSDVMLDASSGDLSIAHDVRGANVDLGATGLTKIGGDVVATGTVALSGGKGVSFADISGASVSISSNGTIAGGSIGATGSVAVQGSAVTLASLGADNASLGATSGGVSLGDATTGGDLMIDASGVATVSGDVTAGGRYSVQGASLVLGGSGKTQQAGGQVLLTSTSGAIQAAAGTTLIADAGGITTDAMLIDSAAGIALGSVTLDSRGGNLGLQAGSGQAVSLGTVNAGMIGGIGTTPNGGASVSGAFVHDANFTAGTITATGMSVSLSAGDMKLGDVKTSGTLDLAAAQGAIATGAVQAGALSVDASGALTGGDYAVGGNASLTGGSIALTSLETGGDLAAATSAGDLAFKTMSAGGTATLQSAGAVKLDQATSAALSITAAGSLGGFSGSSAQLTANSGDLGVNAGGAVQLSGATATAGALTIDGNSVAIGGAITAGKALTVSAVTSLTMQDAQAGAGLTLQSGDPLSAGTLTAGGDAAITGGKDVAITGLTAGGALTLTSAGNASLGSGSVGGTALIDAGGMATLGSLSAGPMLTVRASDATITGTQSAATVAFENRNGDTTAMNLGDGAGSGGFSLSAAEIGLVKADTLIFRQGAGDVQVGTLAFTADAGRKTVELLGTGLMTISGTVSGSGSGRLFQFGGSDTADSAMANAIWVRATPTAGGRLLFGDANLDLRGDRIAVGLSDGFVDDLQGASVESVITNFVGNANSALYNATLGGGGYDAAAPILVSANSMTVHYGQYALFQNTGPARTSTGVVLGGTVSAPISHALVLDTMPGDNAFALFGTLNGIGGSGASLLGGDVIALGNADLSNTRVNGCLAGSGSGCLAAIIIQPTLQVFQASQEDVFGSALDLSVPFDPLVGGTNEELLTGLAALGPDDSDGPPQDGGTTR